MKILKFLSKKTRHTLDYISGKLDRIHYVVDEFLWNFEK